MRQKTLLRIFLGLVFMSFSLVICQNHTAAAGCSVPSPFGLAPCQGYFTGLTDANFNAAVNIFPIGIVNSNGVYANSGATFISDINTFLNSGNHQDQIGAAFIIDTMMGHNGFFQGAGNFSNGVNYAVAEDSAWQSLVNSYANGTTIGYGVNWDAPADCVSGALNSGYFTDMADDAFHGANCALDTTPEIIFYWPGGGSYEIGLNCGNLMGSVTPPPTVPVPQPHGSISISCNPSASQYSATVNYGDSNGYSTTGTISTGTWNSGNVSSGSTTPIPTSATNPYSSQTVTLTVFDSGNNSDNYYYPSTYPSPCLVLSCGSLTTNPNPLDPYMTYSATVTVTTSTGTAPPGATMSISITPTGGVSSGSAPVTGSGGATFSGLGPTGATGTYTATWTLSASGTTKSCSQTFQVVDLSYLQVYGGDVTVGGSPSATDNQCVTQSNSGVFSWWDSESSNFSGAGTQYAVQAEQQIEGFASAQKSPSSPPSSPSGLSFSNTSGVNPTGLGLFGGYFNADANSYDCDNFTSDVTTDPYLTTYTSNQNIDLNSPMTVSANSNGAPTVIEVNNANVYINNDITYGNTDWTSPSQIPDFRLVVVGGNIYINNTVNELDGLYVAEPVGTTGGAIYTCATGDVASYQISPTTITNYNSTCDGQLHANGSFIAAQVVFLRTFGSAGESTSDSLNSNKAAEVFDYTPEMWLPRGNINPYSGYTAITGLPPVL